MIINILYLFHNLITLTITFLHALFSTRAQIAFQLHSQQQQIKVYKTEFPRPRFKPHEKIYWIMMRKLCQNWKSSLHIVRPETVIRWHRNRFRIFWAKLSCRKTAGRSPITAELQNLIYRLSQDNSDWGKQRIRDELRLLGYSVSPQTIQKYRYRPGIFPQQGSQSWSTFLKNHLPDIMAADLFTVPGLKNQLFQGIVFLNIKTRQIVHWAVTDQNPNSFWTAQQLLIAQMRSPYQKTILTDCGSIFKKCFDQMCIQLDLKHTCTAPHSPWMNGYCERVIGSIKHECTDHFIFLNQKHFAKVMREYVYYYNHIRPHRSLDHNSPFRRDIQYDGNIQSQPVLNGLHHKYYCKTA